jgi:Ran GTPase-activating protein (RanGAP) involved in mRNA processing and transport
MPVRKFQGKSQGAKRAPKEQPKPKTTDLSTKPVRFYISRKGKVFPVRVLFQGETKYGERAKVCMMNEKNPDENAWWCDSGNLYQSKREALQAMEDRENETPEEDEDQEGDEEGEEEEESEEGEVPF